MIKDAFKRLIRKSKRNTGILLINILGLSAGIAVFLLISMWISNQMGYDSKEGTDNVYRLSFGNSTYLTAGEGPFFAENCFEIENIVRFRTLGSVQFSYQNNTTRVANMRLADSTVFDIFPYELIQGNKKDALVAPGTVVLTESVARTLFGGEDPVGKSVKVDGAFDIVVTGVMKDVDHTFNPVDVLGSFVTLRMMNEEPDILESLRTNQHQTYFLLKDNVSIEDLREKIHRLNIELFEIENQNIENRVELVKMSDLYFHPVHGTREVHGNRSLVTIFLAISFLTLIIACINFINLTIAKSSDSALEVGVKKVSGATSSGLFYTFLAESVILVIISALIALFIVLLVLPGFNNLVGTNLLFSSYITPINITGFIILVLAIGLLAGMIPAGRFSAFSPLVYLRSMSVSGKPRTTFRTALVIFQFTVSAVLVISVFVIARQMNYVKNYNLGYNHENIIRVNFANDMIEKKDVFRDRVKTIPGVNEVSYSGSAFFQNTNFEVFYYEDQRYLTRFLTVEPDFIKTLDIEIISGRNFSYNRPADRLNTCILNQRAADLIGLDYATAPGKIINRHDWYLTTIPSERLEIIGIVKNFNITSLRDSIPPYLICWGNWFGTFNIRIAESNQNETIRAIEEVWNDMIPAVPISYRYMDEIINDQYENEARISKIIIYFSLLAILIASFGLLGLTAISVQSRTKEIGIKKVHGASRKNIIIQVAGGFTKWVAISLVLGTPVAILFMNRWLSGFAYRTSISPGIVILAWIVLLVIALLTVLYHTVKISDTNPAESVKYE